MRYNSIDNLTELKLELDSINNYETVKKFINEARIKIKAEEITYDSLSKIFKKSLLNRIIPFWEGTKWSFEGHTSKPKFGEIACGYFVSTTLQDVGVSLNRYKLAQQSPINVAESLSLNLPVIEIAEDSRKQNIKAIDEKLKEGIHFIGFDQSHVGYVLKEKGELYLIHSNYIGAKGVEIEKIEESEVFSSYNKFYLAEISTNEYLLRNWIEGIQIEIK